MSNRDDLPAVIITLVVVVVILFTGNYLVSAVIDTTAESTIGDDDTTRVDRTVLLDGLDTVTIDNEVGTNETVYNSLGYAVVLTGSNDSYVESAETIPIATDDTWTVSTGVAVNSSATSSTMTVLTASGRLEIVYNGSASQYEAWYYADDLGGSTQVNISAPSPTNLTNVMVVRDGSDITIYRNATPGETDTITDSDAVDAPLASDNLAGKLDETRTFDDALDSTERNATVDNPVAPRKATNRTSRIMYDEPNRATQRIFFTSTELTTSNVTFGDGYAGEELEGKSFLNDITGATDYRWDTDGPLIKPVSGGQLDGAPVAYVEFDLGENALVSNLADDWSSTIQLAGVLLILLPLGIVLLYLQGIRGRRR